MFVPDNIRDGSSTRSLLKYGRVEGLMEMLRTCAKVRIHISYVYRKDSMGVMRVIYRREFRGICYVY